MLTVNNQPFFGRVEEQKQLRALLAEALHTPPHETLPFVVLLFGDGGMGKTTLARRFYDIVRGEFRQQFQALWVDWEDERRMASRLQVGRDHIGAEALFASLYVVACRAGWQQPFARFAKEREQREAVAAQALNALTAERDDSQLAALRGAGATLIAKLVGANVPLVGKAGEEMARAFAEVGIKRGAEELASLRAHATDRLKARLAPDQLELFLNPDERQAAALAAGFAQVAARTPLVIFLDTYEIVDRADHWLRLIIKQAGPQVLWVIAGRDNLLKSRQLGDAYFKGYADEFPRRLYPYDMRQLALEDVRAYFATCVPERPLDEATLEAIGRATRGIPLAVREAAEIWRTGQPLEALVGGIDEDTPSRQIVRCMTDRYLLHCVRDERDHQLLAALALARGNRELLRAMLGDGQDLNLAATLRRLERDYASVHREEARLHDDPASFFLEDLREPTQRGEAWVQTLIQRALDALDAQLATCEAALPLLEERCGDEEWVQLVVSRSDYLFWQDGEAAWRWLIPRFVESLVYSRELRQGLSRVATTWKPSFKGRSAKRLQLLQHATHLPPYSSDLEAAAALLEELSRLARQAWLSGAGEAERQAILHYYHGLLAAQRKDYDEASRRYTQAEAGLPQEGEVLRGMLAEAWDGVGWVLGYNHKPGSVEQAVDVFRRAIVLDSNNAKLHNNLGAMYVKLRQTEEAADAFKHAVILDPTFAWAYNNLGVTYHDLKYSNEAITALQQAISLSPKQAVFHNNLGTVYRDLKRINEAIMTLQHAISLNPRQATFHNNLGDVYASIGRYEDASTAYQQAIALDPKDAALHYNLGNAYFPQRAFEQARACFVEAMRLEPDIAFSALVHLGLIARYEGQAAESEEFFQQALELWDGAWRAPLESPFGLLESKASALLCTGQAAAALATLREALAQRLPGNTIDLYYYEWLASAPQPPAGVEEVVALLRGEEAGSGERGA